MYYCKNNVVYMKYIFHLALKQASLPPPVLNHNLHKPSSQWPTSSWQQREAASSGTVPGERQTWTTWLPALTNLNINIFTFLLFNPFKIFNSWHRYADIEQLSIHVCLTNLPSHHAPSHLGSPIPMVGVSEGEMYSLRQKDARAYPIAGPSILRK